MNLNNGFILFVHFLINKMYKQYFMIKFYILHSENFKIQNTILRNFNTVAKICEKVVRLNMTSTTKVKV